MNVTLLNTLDTGGAGVAARRLLAALRRHGTNAHLLVQERQGAVQAGLVPLAFLPGERRLALARFVLERALFWPNERDASVRFAFSPARIGADLARHPLVRQADVLHVHWINFGFLSLDGLENLLRLGKPVVWTLHDMWAFTGGCHYSRGCENFRTHCRLCPFLRRPGERDLSFQVFEKKIRAYQNAPLTFVAASEWLAQQAHESALLANFDIHSIPNPIDTTTWQPADRQAARRELALPPDKKLLLFGAGNLADERKGFHFLTNALERLKASAPPDAAMPELVVFGKNDPAALAQLPVRVYNLGVVSSENQLIGTYNAVDALVVPSLEDNLPNTIVEALACGTPVVAFGTGGIPEMIQHRQTGYLAPPRDTAALAEGMRWVLAEDDNKLREAARQFALKTYSEKRIAGQYAALYRSYEK